MDDVSAHKTALRKRFRAWRAALSEAEWAERSAAICRALAVFAPVRSARTVAAFWPLAHRHEPDLRPLLRAFAARGVRVALPEVSPGSDAMVFREMDGRWAEDGAGIAAPRGPLVPPEALDVAIVPALAVDRSGVRLGYGKGFYDRFLAGRTVPTVVPLFEGLFVDTLPAGPYDVRVAAVATERGVVPTEPTAREA